MTPLSRPAEREASPRRRRQMREASVPARREACGPTDGRERLMRRVAHDLRSPLASIQGWADLLERHGADDGEMTRRAVDGIRRGIDEQVRLLDGLVDAARVVSGSLQLRRAPVSLWPLLEAALRDVAPLAQSREVELLPSAPMSAPAVLADAQRLRQVLMHLLINAVRFSPRNTQVRIRLELEPHWVTVEIGDQGPGIAPDRVAGLLECGELPMGLPMIQALCALHGGGLQLSSAGDDSTGTVARVRLPRIDQA